MTNLKDALMELAQKKLFGAYYTPDAVVRSLVSWAIASPSDRMLDPSCGDGRFLTAHKNSVGVEGDPKAAQVVHERAPGCLIHQGDFFSWAANTKERFECAAGNPPFIRYQRFTGAIREAAQRICALHGAQFTSLSSSWAPFLVATASLLKPGGRMAFVVPAEVGHAPYAVPLLQYLVRHFSEVKIFAIKEKLFPDLSEDCWLLFCRGFGRSAESIEFRAVQRFRPTKHPPDADRSIAIDDWKQWGYRLRPFLLPTAVMDLYRSIVASPQAHRLSDLARISIGYVTGANDFFHLRPILADQLSIPRRFLVPAVRNGRDLCGRVITSQTVETWRAENRPNFLLWLRPQDVLPEPVRSYLDSRPGRDARETYKCRNRSPWYAVPDVRAPDGFLSYMSGVTPSLVANPAGCVAANSVHVVHMRAGKKIDGLQHAWGDPVTQLSCEIEGHPLGGGMLKVEPREAGQIVVRQGGPRSGRESDALMEATLLMRSWRHNG